MSMSRSKDEILRLIFILFLGQLVSLNLAITSFTSSLLSNLGVDTPLTQSFFTYLGLALAYVPVLLYRRQKLMVPWYWYALIGFIDVQGNYLVVKAYQFSSITSVTLLDCWTIPWVIVLTWLFIGTRYSIGQFVGAAVCILGLGLIFLSDAEESTSGGTKPLLGDALVVAGTLCYAISNVGEEFCVKHRDRVEVVAMIGVFGLLVSTCEISIAERKDLEAVKWTPEIVLLFVGFALSTFMFYSIVPFVLQMSGAALFNLSLLTSDMWAIVIRIFFYRQKVDWLYYLSFAFVTLGLVIYSISEKEPVTITEIENRSVDVNIEYQLVNEENEAPRIETMDS